MLGAALVSPHLDEEWTSIDCCPSFFSPKLKIIPNSTNVVVQENSMVISLRRRHSSMDEDLDVTSVENNIRILRKCKKILLKLMTRYHDDREKLMLRNEGRYTNSRRIASAVSNKLRRTVHILQNKHSSITPISASSSKRIRDSSWLVEQLELDFREAEPWMQNLIQQYVDEVRDNGGLKSSNHESGVGI